MTNVLRDHGSLEEVWEGFSIEGKFIGIKNFELGHINETYIALYDCNNQEKKYVHQKINHEVFRNIDGLMGNIRKVTNYIKDKLSRRQEFDLDRKVLSLVQTKEGGDYLKDSSGKIWRSFNYIDNSKSFEVVRDSDIAYKVGKSFGEFQKLLSDFSTSELVETILRFHDTPLRFNQLEEAIKRDEFGRAKYVEEEINFLMSRKREIDRLVDLTLLGKVPLRAVHYDTKCNNVLFDSVTENPLCVVDLDTVMPGLSLYDFGDMIRSGCNSAYEDEQDLFKVEIDSNFFNAMAEGYLDSTRSFLNKVEKNNLIFSVKLLGLELGARFLTDHLRGDKYFRILREEHNLDRARVQLKFVESVEKKEKELERIVRGFV